MLARLTKYRCQYLMILPAVILLFIFNYVPMAGIQVDFNDFHIGLTINNSPWVGLDMRGLSDSSSRSAIFLISSHGSVVAYILQSLLPLVGLFAVMC